MSAYHELRTFAYNERCITITITGREALAIIAAEVTTEISDDLTGRILDAVRTQGTPARPLMACAHCGHTLAEHVSIDECAECVLEHMHGDRERSEICQDYDH